MKLTSISLNKPEYYKQYYQRNKEYLRHRQRLRYYSNSPKFFELLREYNKILLERKEINRRTIKNEIVKGSFKCNKNDTSTKFVLNFD